MPPVTKNYRSGEYLFKEKEASRSLFIIKRGAVSIQKWNGEIFFEVAKAQTGEVLGELSFFDRLPRSASAMAIMDVEVIEISFESMEEIYSKIPDYVKTMVAGMADRLRRANERIQLLEKQRSKNE